VLLDNVNLKVGLANGRLTVQPAEANVTGGTIRLEAAVKGSGLEWAIVRPTLTFGPNDILINNLAWALRRLPVFGMPGSGRYRVQPVHVADVARICLDAAEGAPGNAIFWVASTSPAAAPGAADDAAATGFANTRRDGYPTGNR